jgi:hypothetical protein
MWCEGAWLVKMGIPGKTNFIVYANAYVFIIIVIITISQV